MKSASVTSSPPPSGQQPALLTSSTTVTAVAAPPPSTTLAATTAAADELALPVITPLAEDGESADSTESLDPLSHLTHIFDKIRKQVIEWGEDANWKIDVFLLPNEDGVPAPGTATPHDPQLLSQGPATPVRPPAPRIDLTGSPRRYPGGVQEMERSLSGTFRYSIQKYWS